MPDPVDVIACPHNLDKRSKSIWTRTRNLIVKDGRWRPEYALLLERYVRALEVARLARERIAARAKTDPEGAYLARGAQGQIVQHPDLKTARDAERDAHEYAKELLLTPAARSKLGDDAPTKPGGKFAGKF